ncbi:MAG TPA: response regulator [Candidatus Obscuribacterales bacterium]
MSKPLVLVVDDHPTHLKVCNLLLDKFGYLSCCLSDPTEALEVFQATDGFAAVLMDWRLPDMDGIECMRRMRRIDEQRSKRTPIIAVTASAMTSDQKLCLSAGMDDFLAKPFLSDDLKFMLAKHIPTTQPAASGLLKDVSAAIANGDLAAADLICAQIVSLFQHIWGEDKRSALDGVLHLANMLKADGLSGEANALESCVRAIFDDARAP